MYIMLIIHQLLHGIVLCLNKGISYLIEPKRPVLITQTDIYIYMAAINST